MAITLVLLLLIPCSYFLFRSQLNYVLYGPSERQIKAKFNRALRLNDPAAYKLSEENLWPQIDEWMASHEVQNCAEHLTEGPGAIWDANLDPFGCYLEGRKCYSFDVYKTEVKEVNGRWIVTQWPSTIDESFTCDSVFFVARSSR